MRMTYGQTRFVILVGDKAIKIGRVKLLNLLIRWIFILPFSKKRRDHYFTKYGKTIVEAIRNEWLQGLYANRREYSYYSRSKDPLVIPTTKIILTGWIIIQDRGNPITNQDLAHFPEPFRQESITDGEMRSPSQYATTKKGKIVLVDYGRIQTIRTLESLQ